MRLAVIGHVEHVTIAAVPGLPTPGEIVHLDEAKVIAGGGGGIAFFQLARSDAAVHLYTAFGNDDSAREVEHAVRDTEAKIHAAHRDEPHTRDLVLITPGGERTIFVVGQPLHPRHDDALPWDDLASMDAVYFTAQDPDVLRAARAARLLVVTARRREALARAGVRPDVVVGSMRDPREAGALSDFGGPPAAVVMTEGALGGSIETADGIERFDAPRAASIGAYGAGDTFAAALTYYLASGRPLRDACSLACRHAAAVLAGVNPLDHQQRLPLREA